MRRQRGFVLGIAAYAAIGASVALLGMGIALKVQSSRLASCKQEFAAFQAQVKANGEAAEKAARAKEAADLAKKEKIDNENKRLRINNANLVKRLRDAHPAGSGVSEAPAGSRRPDLACYDRAEFVRAYGNLVAGVRSLADEGTESAIDLNSAREWAAGR